jgi:hypothetical protein
MTRGRRKHARQLGVAAVILGIGYLLYDQREWIWLVAYVTFLVLCVVFWIAFVRRTTCDVLTTSGRGCRNNARGALGACGFNSHRRLKRRAILLKLGLRRASPPPTVWGTGQPSGPGGPVEGPMFELEPRLGRSAYDITMLVATLISTVATVVSTVLAIA